MEREEVEELLKERLAPVDEKVATINDNIATVRTDGANLRAGVDTLRNDFADLNQTLTA